MDIHPAPLSLKQRTPRAFLFKMALSIFCAETFIMLLFLILPKLPDLLETFVDATLLSILIAPALYFFVYRPLLQEIVERSKVEVELRRSQMRLEQQARELEETLKQLQQAPQLLQTEKMSSLGQLVAGIAHEINNPVNFIHGNLIHIQKYSQNLLDLVQLYQKHYPDPEPEIQATIEDIDLAFLQADLTKILKSMKVGTDRICQIVLSLRNFSRMDEGEFKSVDIHEGIDSTLIILQHRLKAKPKCPAIELIKDYGTLPRVECFPGQLNQVFMNILANALDAIEELNDKRTYLEIQDNPSRITIRTSVIDPDRVQIAIADNGAGIPESIQKQIYNPFFTTKLVGKGTGMGMAIAYQIIAEKHGGTIECLSQPGRGTTFAIQIPVRQSLRQEFKI